MLEHEPHPFAMAIDASDAFAESGHEIIDRLEQHVGQDRAFDVSPKSFDQIEARAIRRQPEDGDLTPVSPEPFAHGLGVMEPAVVADQPDLPAGVHSNQCDEEFKEVLTTLGVGDRAGDLAGGVVYAAVDDLFFILAGSRDLGLLTDRSPHAGQRRMTVDLHLILKDQDFSRAGLSRLFFSRISCRRAFSYAASLRLPFMVCLGRWKERPSW